ncbi:type II toxin-antitoxin system RelE family toxin [Candidatus Venteria ishoeyi]|uniref:Plasmid stabilisation system protein n=1 Tax=Candidatus Venteria ishoeyi TaxID=1899563 RepID=A0A1H6F819_9GAMM|nr:type II toxin-antitoxin system RelE/ParE family toxin [Candidatus Venteria ishoeyi]SEH05858.1 Plasmid stabilisation system protein [Candidatus Venteria ishoeyi]SEH06268.1 Plasmid stabilisation system protein [Candidatus Venteria ishoeyi]
MNVHFERSFLRDIRKIRDKQLLDQIEKIITDVKQAESLDVMRNLKKLQGYNTFYRIRLRDYRLGLEYMDGDIVFVRILHRRDIYRYFP